MDFSFNPEQEQLYRQALRFAREHLARMPEGKAPPEQRLRAAFERLGEFGLLGLNIPIRYGGSVLEALGAGAEDFGLVFAAAAHMFACATPIFEAGSDALRQRVLPRLCRGEWIAANAVSEPQAGSDTAAISARAERTATGYTLSGDKCYVSNAAAADLFVVYASTRPEHGYLGLSAFAVERARPGVEVGPPMPKMGLDSAPLSSVRFDGCLLSEADRIGPEGAGAALLQRSMIWERTCLLAAYLGQMQRVLAASVEYATTRRQFQRPIARNQAISHRIVDMQLRLESARLLLYRACWLIDRGEDAAVASSLAKLAVSEAAVQGALDGVRIHGGLGYLKSGGLEAALRDAVPSLVFSGTNELQRELIAAHLGL
jgi:alkylation response protein AidB-like acyl-CoA dehydrogenase